MSQLLVERLLDFSGGRNTSESDHRLPDNQTPDDLNLIGRTVGAIEKRTGTTQWTTYSPVSEMVLGLHRYYKSDGTKYLVYSAGDRLLFEDEGRVVHQIEEGFVPCQPFSFATFQDWLYMANFADLCYRWNGADLRATGLVRATVPAGLTGTEAGTGGFLDDGEYFYRITADYGVLGESNLSVESLSVTLVLGTGTQTVTLPDLSSYIPEGAVGLRVWRTLKNPTDNPNLRIFYFVGTTTGEFEDTKHDDELRTEYPGDRAMPFNAAFLAKHRNRLWYGNCMERDGSLAYNSRVAYSGLYTPDILGDNSIDPGYIDVFPNDDDVVTGILALRGNIVVYKRRHIYVIMGTSYLDFEVRDTHSDIGCIAPLSLAAGDNKHFFLGSDGRFYAFDGTRPVAISDSIRPDLEELSNTAKLWTFGFYANKRYYCAVSL